MDIQITEIGLDEQQQIRGGDWYCCLFGIIEGLTFVSGMM